MRGISGILREMWLLRLVSGELPFGKGSSPSFLLAKQFLSGILDL